MELTSQQIESLTTGPHLIKGNRKGTLEFNLNQRVTDGFLTDHYDEKLNFMSNGCKYTLGDSVNCNHILGVDLEIWFWLVAALFVIIVFAIKVLIGIFRGENVLDVLEKELDEAVDFDLDYDDDDNDD